MILACLAVTGKVRQLEFGKKKKVPIGFSLQFFFLFNNIKNL